MGSDILSKCPRSRSRRDESAALSGWAAPPRSHQSRGGLSPSWPTTWASSLGRAYWKIRLVLKEMNDIESEFHPPQIFIYYLKLLQKKLCCLSFSSEITLEATCDSFYFSLTVFTKVSIMWKVGSRPYDSTSEQWENGKYVCCPTTFGTFFFTFFL